MNKMDLIAAVADQTDLPKAKAAEAVDAVFGAIEGGAQEERGGAPGRLRLVRHGQARRPRTGRNPRTGEEIQIPRRPRRYP